MLDVAGLDVGVLASVSESDGIVDTVELTPETRVEIDGVADAVVGVPPNCVVGLRLGEDPETVFDTDVVEKEFPILDWEEVLELDERGVLIVVERDPSAEPRPPVRGAVDEGERSNVDMPGILFVTDIDVCRFVVLDLDVDVSDVVNFVVLTLVVEVSDEEVSDDREEKFVRDLVLVTVTDGVGFRDEVVAVEETRFFVGVVLVCLEVFELLDVPEVFFKVDDDLRVVAALAVDKTVEDFLGVELALCEDAED